MQMLYAVIGACFLPMLAAVLLVLNSRRHLGEKWRNGPLANAVLAATLVFFAWAGFQ